MIGFPGGVRHGLVACILTAAPLLSGCDPCDGVAACAGGDGVIISYQGDIVLRHAAAPAESVLVQFVRTAGAELLPSGTLSAYSDSLGRFELRGETARSAPVVGKLIIHQPEPASPLEYEEVPLVPTSVATDAKYLGSWSVEHPHFGYFADMIYRDTRAHAAGVEVEVRRRGGIEIEPSTFTAVTDVAGRFPLRPVARDTGEVIFDVVIRPPAPYRPLTYENQRMRARLDDNPAPHYGTFWIGPHLPYLGLILWGDTGHGAVDIEVEFRRIGGIEVSPATYVTKTNQFANFWLGPAPDGYGVVEAELVIRPPAPYLTITDTITLETTDAPIQNALAGTWILRR